MKSYILILGLAVFVIFSCGCSKTANVEEDAKQFIQSYTKTYQQLAYESDKAAWLANTDINKEHTQKEIEAEKKLVEFSGKKETILKVKELLAKKDQLNPLTVKKLGVI